MVVGALIGGDGQVKRSIVQRASTREKKTPDKKNTLTATAKKRSPKSGPECRLLPWGQCTFGDLTLRPNAPNARVLRVQACRKKREVPLDPRVVTDTGREVMMIDPCHAMDPHSITTAKVDGRANRTIRETHKGLAENIAALHWVSEQAGVRMVIMHGTLLGWHWNHCVMPFDADLDVSQLDILIGSVEFLLR